MCTFVGNGTTHHAQRLPPEIPPPFVPSCSQAFPVSHTRTFLYLCLVALTPRVNKEITVNANVKGIHQDRSLEVSPGGYKGSALFNFAECALDEKIPAASVDRILAHSPATRLPATQQ